MSFLLCVVVAAFTFEDSGQEMGGDGFHPTQKMKSWRRWRLMKKLTIRRSWISRGKGLQKQLREIEKFTDVDQMFRDGQKEKWKGDLQEIEQKRNELLAEHQRMHKRSQKMQSLQDKKKKYLKDACACDEETGKVRDEINEREARFLELAQKSNNCRMADDLEEEMCCFDSVMEQLFTLGAAHARQQIQSRQEEFNRIRSSATLVHMAGREERGEEVEERQVGAMKAFRLVPIEKVHVHHADSSNRCRRMKFCEREWKEGGDWPEKKEKTAKGRTQEPLKKTARARTQAPLKIEAIRWKGGDFKKSGRKRNAKRGRKRRNIRTEKGSGGRSARSSS